MKNSVLEVRKITMALNITGYLLNSLIMIKEEGDRHIRIIRKANNSFYSVVLNKNQPITKLIYSKSIPLPESEILNSEFKGIFFPLKKLESLKICSPVENNINLKSKMMEVSKIYQVVINGNERTLTIVVSTENSQVFTGYSVHLPTDAYSKELGEKIAKGRALNPKTNLTPNTNLGNLDKKFILYAIADNFASKIQKGIVEIKGVKNILPKKKV